MSRITSRRGFTLIELIVVVIIIGVLASIAAVAYNQFVGNSRSTAILATAKQVDKAIAARSANADKTVYALTAAGEIATNSATLGPLSGVDSVSGTNGAASTNPTKVKVVDGTRSACLTYANSQPGEAASIALATDTNIGC